MSQSGTVHRSLNNQCPEHPTKGWRGPLLFSWSSEKKIIRGNPDPKYISISYVERQNLTMRKGMRRFTRLTNGFSKKAEDLAYAVSLHFMYYNFVRIHQSLRVTPAMQAGITDHLSTIEDIARLADQQV